MRQAKPECGRHGPGIARPAGRPANRSRCVALHIAGACRAWQGRWPAPPGHPSAQKPRARHCHPRDQAVL